MLVIDKRLAIPLREFEFTFARSSGPGGQNVNKVNTKVTLRWPVTSSNSLPEAVKARFVAQYARRISKHGDLLVTSQRFRDQGRNVADCLAKLRVMLLAVARPPKRRRPTRRRAPRANAASRISRDAPRPNGCGGNRARMREPAAAQDPPLPMSPVIRRIRSGSLAIRAVDPGFPEDLLPSRQDSRAGNECFPGGEFAFSGWQCKGTLIMFGKAEWFRLKSSGWGLRPITWQGWTYAVAWIVVLSTPFLALLSFRLVIESFIWMAASMTFLVWDVWQIVKTIRSAEDADVLYIGDDATQNVATRNYDLHLKQ